LTSLWRSFRLNQSGNEPAIARFSLQLEGQKAADTPAIYNNVLSLI
jgi:hypothetical protein